MASVKCFEDLQAFQRARELTRQVYRVSSAGRFSRDYPLRDQIRRAAISVMSNIAEGFERDGDREFVQFLSTAKGSCGEVRAQLYAAMDQGYVDEEQFDALSARVVEISRMLARLIEYLKQSPLRGKKFNAS